MKHKLFAVISIAMGLIFMMMGTASAQTTARYMEKLDRVSLRSIRERLLC